MGELFVIVGHFGPGHWRIGFSGRVYTVQALADRDLEALIGDNEGSRDKYSIKRLMDL